MPNPREGGGDFSPPLVAYHHRMTDIKAVIADSAVSIKSIISYVVSFFFFRFFISSPLSDYIISYFYKYVNRFCKNIFYFLKKFPAGFPGGIFYDYSSIFAPQNGQYEYFFPIMYATPQHTEQMRR